MLKTRIALATCSFLALVAGGALAGERDTVPVSIDTAKRFAAGALGTAHNSADSHQYIGCGINVTANGSTTGTCTAITSTGQSASCFFADKPALVGAIQALPSDGYLVFFWDASGACASMYVSNNSGSEHRQ